MAFRKKKPTWGRCLVYADDAVIYMFDDRKVPYDDTFYLQSYSVDMALSRETKRLLDIWHKRWRHRSDWHFCLIDRIFYLYYYLHRNISNPVYRDQILEHLREDFKLVDWEKSTIEGMWNDD